MTLKDWYRDHVKNGESKREAVYQLWHGAWKRSHLIRDPGTNIFEEDWEILLVLDACRADLMREVVDQYDFLSGETRWSVGSSSREWIMKTFEGEHPETSYITGNPFSQELLDASELGHLEEVWKESWDDEIGTILPRPLTDRAIEHWKSESPDRMIVHYMQPHYPFIEDPIADVIELQAFGESAPKSVWTRLRQNPELTFEDIWPRYRRNLELVLEDVQLLLQNVESDTVVITADHGNSMGEKWLYGHNKGVVTREQREVPWCVTSAENTGEYQPDIQREDVTEDVQSRLEDLGYR